ncbi:MAG: D-alanyl-D-alanine carboxypeptidase [Pseudomonadota bacterium]
MRTDIGSTAPRVARGLFAFVMAVAVFASYNLTFSDEAEAKKRKKYKSKKVSKSYKSRGNPKYAGIVVDAKTGKVLYSRNANAKRYPASLTKMMTLYLMFEDINAGRISKSTRLVMSKAGARRQPSKIGLRPGQTISMEQAILSLVTKSANDVATAVGDQLAGSEAAFARRMTRKARQLGMMNTTFKNANGLTQRGQITTAADMAKLGMALREHFPNSYRYFNTRIFKLGKRRYGNHNKLLGRVRGVDGIKTGYTRASGFNLVSSVRTNGRSIVAVVMGGRTGARRNAQMQRLISGYLHKASRGKGRRQIAAARDSFTGAPVASAPQMSKTVVSKAQSLIQNRIVTAHAVSKTDQRLEQKVAAKIQTKRPEVAFAPDRVVTASAGASSTRKDMGFQIQIAASNNKAALHDMLTAVQRKNRKLLGGREIYMPTVVKNGVKLYRARFAGFGSKKRASQACRALKRQRIDCLAINS